MDINKNTSPATQEEMYSLPSEPGQNNFSTPSDYFDSLPGKVMDRILSEQKLPFFLLRPTFAIPALAAISGVIVFLILFNKNDIASDEMLLSENEIQQVVDNPELYNIDDADITEQYISSDIPDESISEETDLPDDEVKTYLEENTGTQNIINEY